jgi:hypothetical protein
MKKICAFIFAMLLGGAVTSVTFAQPTYADEQCDRTFIGFRSWAHGLTKTVNGSCVVDMEQARPQGTANEDDATAAFVWRIILNVTIDLTLAASYVALILIIYGGFKYILSTGEPNKVSSAKTIITNSVIGFIIAMLATLIVNTIIMIIGGAAS